MKREKLLSRYASLRQNLEELHTQCELVEFEIREIERELTLSDIQIPLEETVVAMRFERRSSQPR